MRVQHFTQTARSWPRGSPARRSARENGRTDPLAAMARPAPSGSGSDLRDFEGPRYAKAPNPADRDSGVLQDLETYVSGQLSSIINYAAARRSGEPISTVPTESAVRRLLHRRITAKQQIPSRRKEHI
jgi:hypothetical protein